MVHIKYVAIQNITAYGFSRGGGGDIASLIPGGAGAIVYSGQQYRLRVRYEYTVPKGAGTFTLRYRDSIKGQWEVKDFWNYQGSGGGTAESEVTCCDVHAPPDFGGPAGGSGLEWTWDFELSIDAGSAYSIAKDTDTIHLFVKHSSYARFYIYKVTAPTSIQKDAQLNVQVEGGYDVPEGETATLHVSFGDENDRPFYQYEHKIDKLTGQGTWSEVLSAKADDVVLWAGEPGFSKSCLWPSNWPFKSDGCYHVSPYGQGGPLLDVRDLMINLTKTPGEDFYSHITDVKHPNDVTFGQDVTVTVDLDRKLSKGSSIEISIWDKGLYPQHIGELAVDTIKDAEGTGSMSVTVKIPGSNIRSQNGPWKLEALSIYTSPETLRQLWPDEYDFTVNVVGASGPKGIGGKVDWSIASVQVVPYQPVQGGLTIFQALVQATPAPTGPMQVQVACRLDGKELFSGYVTYGANMIFLAVSSQPWTATLGSHTLTWEVDPNKQYDDQKRVNNIRELKFMVTQSYTPPPPPPGQPPTNPQETFDFYVTATPTEQILIGNATATWATYTVNVKLISGAVQPVQLELMGAPAGLSYSFTPSSGAPPYSSTLTLTTPDPPWLPAGSYPLTIKASGGKEGLYKERYKPLTLTVPEGPNYILSIAPSEAQAKPGANITFTISASSDTGYPNYVNLVASGVPNGASQKLEPTAMIPPSKSTLTLELGKDVTPGVYVIVVTGSGPGAQSAAVTLTVMGPTAPMPQPASNEDLIVNGLAAGILGVIIAAVAGGAFLAFRRIKTRRAKTFCIECGAQITAGLPYCRHCGVKQPQPGKGD
jgi:ribosomal protein L40E